jgi:hypothetical protein
VSPKLLGVLVTASLVCWTAHLMASTGGRTGGSTSTTGCSCHSSSPNTGGAVTVSITGPQTVQTGSTSAFTISVTGGPSGTTGGFNLSADGGTFTAGAGNKVSSGQLTHSDGTRRSWSFQWTAPASSGTYHFYAVGQPTNGSGTGGDSWNWYGGAAGTAFTITVDAVTPVLNASWGRLKAKYR